MGDTPSARTEPNSELHKEFRSLTALLSLVTSFNSQGPPSPMLQFQWELRRQREPSPEHVGSRGNFASNAISTLLSRDVEVIAVAAENNGSRSRTQASFVVAAQPREQENLQRLDVQGVRWRAILDTSVTDVDCDAEDTAPCVLAAPGQSHWPAIGRRQWHGFKIRSRDPLNNHIATLVDYCNSMKTATRQEQPSLFQTFTSYIVSTCWKKMHRRISHWFSQGFIYSLGSLSKDTLQFSFREYTRGSNRWRDDLLCKALRTMSHEMVIELMNQHPKGSHPKPTRLLAACKKMLDSNKEVAYGIETCVEFHDIFVAALASYAKALATLHTAFVTQNVSMRQKTEAAAEVKKYGQVIWMFSHTPMLQHHLEGLRKHGALYMPIERSRGFYRAHLGFGDPLGEQDEDGDVDMEVCRLMRNDHRAAMDKVFVEWMCLQVKYFEAIHKLSDYYRRFGDQTPEVKISLLAVKTPYVTMEPWEHTVQKAIVRPSSHQLVANASPIDTDTAMRLIKDLGQVDNAALERTYKGVLSKWDRSAFFGSTHCEAALASLIKYGGANNSICDRPPPLDVENLNLSAIAVSRHCCPVCWELMAVFRADTEGFRAGDHQAIVSPVSLPVWLPVDVLQHMVDRFRDHLRDELNVMYNEAKWNAQPLSEPRLLEDDGFGFRCLTPPPTLHQGS